MTELRDLLQEAGLARVSAEIERVALPSIRLRATETDEDPLPIGATQFGGLPDLPEDLSWPEHDGAPLPFLAQFNLADVSQYDQERLLPDTGMLYFFFDVELFFDSGLDDGISSAVLYSTSPISELEPGDTPDPEPSEIYDSCSLTCTTEITLPDYSRYDNSSLKRLGFKKHLSDEEQKAYFHVGDQLAGTVGTTHHTPLHRLLGHADPVQWDMQNQLPKPVNDWRLLFQMDSDDEPDTSWGDTGRIYFWIRLKDLQKRDFSKTRLLLQSS